MARSLRERVGSALLGSSGCARRRKRSVCRDGIMSNLSGGGRELCELCEDGAGGGEGIAVMIHRLIGLTGCYYVRICGLLNYCVRFIIVE